jgi:predicted RNase H-like HicB family nuclease
MKNIAWGKTALRHLSIEFEKEADGRWIAEIPAMPGVIAYGKTRAEAAQAVKVLALRVIASDLEAEGTKPDCRKLEISIACP